MLDMNVTKRLATTAGAKDVACVASYLRWCDDTHDCDRTIALLRKNRPELFRK
jgi:hypothetical protein